MARLLPTGRPLTCLLALVAWAFFLVGCQPESSPRANPAATAPSATAATPIRFQLDWYPQAEHGGFYQALARGFYEEAGLDVTILPGGPGARTPQRVIGGAADVSIYRSDDLLLQVAEGLPFVLLAPFMQHDPQALLLHASNPIDRFEELDGQRVMAIPGTNWIAYLEKRYDIRLQIIPMNFGLAQFMADPGFIQQCFLTSEPFHVQQQGVAAKVLPIAQSGYDPYRVIFTTQAFLRDQPEAARRFVAASLRGWQEFIEGDPAPAFAAIAQANPQMPEAQMRFSHAAQRAHRLVTGDPTQGEALGRLDPARLQAEQATLLDLGILRQPIPLEHWVDLPAVPPFAVAAEELVVPAD